MRGFVKKALDNFPSTGLIGKSMRRWGLVFAGGSGYDWKSEAGDVQANLTAAIGMQTIVDKLQQSGFRAVKNVKGSDEPIVDEVQTRGVELLIQAGGFTVKQFITILACSCKLAGPAYIVATRSESDGKLQAITPFLAGQVTQNGDGVRFDVKRHGDGAVKTVEAEDVVIIPYGLPDPKNPLLTIAPAAVAYRQLCGDNEAATFMASVLKNMGIISYLISPKVQENGMKGFSKQQRKDHEEKMTTMTRDKRGGVYASPDPIDMHKLGMSPDELSVSEYKRLLIVEILGALGVDPMVCSLPSDNRTYNNYGEARKALVEDTIMPLWAILLEGLQAFLVAEKFLKEGTLLAVDETKYPEMAEDEDKRSARARENFKSLLTTRGEARVAAGIVEKPDDPRLYSEIMSELKAASAGVRDFPVTERRKAIAKRLRELEDQSKDA